MTIASEITRLQNDKAAICTAIENKGVTVGNVTLDDYASCIDAISSGPNTYFIDILAIGGGGSGDSLGGGGGGGYVEKCKHIIYCKCNYVCIGSGGCYCSQYKSSNSGNSTRFSTGDGCICALGGGGAGKMGGSGGCRCMACTIKINGTYYIQGHAGGYIGLLCNGCPQCIQTCSGGGGAGAAGCCGGAFSTSRKCAYGGRGICTYISGECKRYAGGGSGTGFYWNSAQTACYCCPVAASCGGGGSSCQGSCDATYYGGGGGGGGGKGCQGIIIIRYPTDGSYGFTTATGGTKYTCGDYTIHCFTSNGCFCIVS